MCTSKFSLKCVHLTNLISFLLSCVVKEKLEKFRRSFLACMKTGVPLFDQVHCKKKGCQIKGDVNALVYKSINLISLYFNFSLKRAFILSFTGDEKN